MPKVCCVKTCKEFWIPNSDLSFFAFPFNNEELKEKWLNAAPGYKALSKHSAICSNHFLPDDYTAFAGRRMLKKNAVPSVFGPRCLNVCDNILDPNAMNERARNFFAEMNMKPQIIHLLRPDDRCDAMIQVSSSNLQGLPMDERATKKYSSVAVQTCPRLSGPSEREKELQHKIKTLQNRLRRREKMIKNVKELVAHLKKAGKSPDNLEDKFLRKFTKFDLELFKNEANNNNVAKNSKTYTQEMKEFASTLYSYSPRAYRFVRAKINLPHTATLRRWIAESVVSSKQEKTRNEELDSDEIEGEDAIEAEEEASTETQDVGSHTDNEMEEVEEIESTAIEEVEEIESTAIEEVKEIEYTAIEEVEEIESTAIEEVESDKMEEVESTEIEEVESIVKEEVHLAETEEVKSIEIKKNPVTSRLPLLIVIPMSVANAHSFHGTLKQHTTKTTTILSTNQDSNSAGVIPKH